LGDAAITAWGTRPPGFSAYIPDLHGDNKQRCELTAYNGSSAGRHKEKFNLQNVKLNKLCVDVSDIKQLL
jgi:hypothetical protein